MSKRCKTCDFIVLPKNAKGHGVCRGGHMYPCTCPLPEMPMLPISVTDAWNSGFQWPPKRRFVTGDDGEQCPVYVARAK